VAGIVVVGVAPGLGSAVADKFAREGLPVGLIARRRATLSAARRALSVEALEAPAYIADESDGRALRWALQGLKASLGVPDALVYSPSLATGHRGAKRPALDLEQMRAANVEGVLTAATEVLPWMVERRQGAFFLAEDEPSASASAVSSPHGTIGLRALAGTLASEFQPVGVHLASVATCGHISPGTKFDAEQVAQFYWGIYQEQPQLWRPHYNYTGEWENEDETRGAALLTADG
jgi:NAD(P)-dependent dehydrogenase (short-subunit alcohol dehydrogenase family)